VTEPERALTAVADAVREDGTLLSQHLREPSGTPGLGMLAAAGPRAEGAEGDYAFVVEAVREGYLLHYGEPRVLSGVEPDLALLAGDHLYALGLERLAGLGDLEAVSELGDLISLCAQVNADRPERPEAPGALWLGAAVAIAAGASEGHQAAKAEIRAGGPEAPAALVSAASRSAADAGIGSALAVAADSIDFDLPDPPARG
jgi:hypothetical protein